MGFFDLNIPYADQSSSPSARSNCIKVVTKVMELGYTGVAYNRTIKGVMSDQDRCSIAPLTLSSLLKFLPSLASSVEFHRHVLGLPRSVPFRQYTRITVCLNSPSEILAINSGNLVLKSYDLLAVKPLYQHAFEQACEKLEIDIISIDFSERLPFRLKQTLIKSAVQRGVYFEITYSRLISDVHERCQVISAAKFLVDWTRGKNLIFSSAASSVNEIRGPYDVANLSSLFGLSMERAKAAISKNCRSLLANALRKKQFFKETVKIERISLNENLDPKEPCSADLFKWDPISSGEHDLLLDDIAKSFAASGKDSHIEKAIDFTSAIDNRPALGFQVKDMISGCESEHSPNNNKDLLHVADISSLPIAENGVTQQPHLSLPKHGSSTDRQCSVSESFENLNSPTDADKTVSNSDEVKTAAQEIVQPKTSVQEEPIEMDVDELQTHSLVSSSESDVVKANGFLCSSASTRDGALCNNGDEKSLAISEDVSRQNKLVLSRHKCLANSASESREKLSLAIDATSTADKCSLGERFRESGDVGVAEDQASIHKSFPMNNVKDDHVISIPQQTSEVLMEDQKQGEADSRITHPLTENAGKYRTKWRRYRYPVYLHPLKRIINPVVFKKVGELVRVFGRTVNELMI